LDITTEPGDKSPRVDDFISQACRSLLVGDFIGKDGKSKLDIKARSLT
jgi:hypothetical protein